ncbi:MAG: hypothetical protein MN733_11995 [Nitrososphaera sp.]|nr:hypothetical protein [Nitrososphaera sp.]
MGLFTTLFGRQWQPVTKDDQKEITSKAIQKIAVTIDSFLARANGGNVGVLLKPGLKFSVLERCLAIQDETLGISMPPIEGYKPLATVYFRDLPPIQQMAEQPYRWSSTTLNERTGIIGTIATFIFAKFVESLTQDEYLAVLTRLCPDLRIAR